MSISNTTETKWTELESILHDLYKISEAEGEKGIKLVSKILFNIINNPSQIEKYGNLNFERIKKKLNCCPPALRILFCVGFEESNNGNRLVWTYSKYTYQQLEIIYNIFQWHRIQDIKQLIMSDFTFKEVVMALDLSVDAKKTQASNSKAESQKSLFKQLIGEGFSAKDAIVAICIDRNTNNNTPPGIDELVDLLNHMGYSCSEAVTMLHDERKEQPPQFHIFDHIDIRYVSELVIMGYSQEQAIEYLQLANSDIDNAVKLLNKEIDLDDICRGDIATCPHLTRFKTLIVTNRKDIGNMKNQDKLKMLDEFHHLLFKHANNSDFEYISKFLGNCEIDKCVAAQRIYRDRCNKTDELKSNDVPVTAMMDLLAQMHCYYCHSTDIGYKLTESETTLIEHTIHGDDAEIDDQFRIKNHKISEASRVLLQKHKKNQRKHNKFNQLDNSQHTGDTALDAFRFGYKYYYWKYFQTLTDVENFDVVNNFATNKTSWYIKPKYESFKEELTQNEVIRLTIEQFNHESQKASLKLSSLHGKSIKADLVKTSDDATVDHSQWEIPKDSPIKLHHLIAIIIYCAYSELSFRFSETFRKINGSESDESLRRRHSNFYWLSRNIHEAVNVFSTSAWRGNIRTLYHGIQRNMIFDSVFCRMHQPLSTTSIYEVAINFSYPKGIIIQLQPDALSRYFECAWLSDFANEHEFLFVGCGNTPLLFSNITNVTTGLDYRIFIKSIGIIDSFTVGGFYSNDDGTIKKKFFSRAAKERNPARLGAVPIDVRHQYVTLKLIKHELGRGKFQKLEPYIQQLFHNVCVKKKKFIIDMQSMQIDIVDNMHDAQGDYCGYAFLKHLFCEEPFEMIKLDVVTRLFPNLKYISVLKLSSISTECLDAILKYLSANKDTNVSYFILKVHSAGNNPMEFPRLALRYQPQFARLNYNIGPIERDMDFTIGLTIAKREGVWTELQSVHLLLPEDECV
eukprot:203947_1